MNGRASVHWGYYEPNALMLYYYATGGTSTLNVGTVGIGCPRMYVPGIVPSLVPTHPLRVLGFGAQGNSKGELGLCR